MGNLYLKEQKALKVIKTALDKHGNNVFVGYSGGKDSKVILNLARSIDPSILVIHNSHPEETCDLNRGVLIIVAEKKEFKYFLSYTSLKAQIDGSTRSEKNKNVVFNGMEMMREDIPNEYNPLGVFGLEIYYPILDWTEDEIWLYIRKYALMTKDQIRNYKSSRPYKEIY